MSLNKNLLSLRDMFNLKHFLYLAIFVQLTLQFSNALSVKSRFNEINKSANNKREYRGLVLNNDMKVILISDPATTKSAASVDVNVGSMNDPPELPGLAHFCEHMLFLGTEKFPKENDFRKYVYDNGGSTNAFTAVDHTNYHFDINNKNLKEGLYRFAQFFIEPLFYQSRMDGEVHVIQSEFMMSFNNDYRRLWQLEKSSADKRHPFSGFSAGNLETLETKAKKNNISVRENLLNFYENWYSANIMTLSVLGKGSLDDLEEMVITMFSSVKNKEIKATNWTKPPFNSDHFECKWYILPIQDIRKLKVSFSIPDLREYYWSKPTQYLSYLLAHDGEGSLQWVLKKRGWIVSIGCGEESVSRGISFFVFYMDLTEEGLSHVDDIITLMYEYINTVKKEGPAKWIFNEYRNMENISFRYQSKNYPLLDVMFIAQGLQTYEIVDVLTAPYLTTEWEPSLINKVFEYLIPNNSRIMIMAKFYENITTEVEPWYKTKFLKERASGSVIEKWQKASYNTVFKMPSKNEFIPTEYNLKSNNDTIGKFPIVIDETPFMKVWFKQDSEFFLPKAYLAFYFRSPFICNDSVSYNNFNMFINLMQDSLNANLYAARFANLNWEISNTGCSFLLIISGYNNKQIILLQKIIKGMNDFEIDEERFKILKDGYRRSLKNFYTIPPVYLAYNNLQFLLSEKFWLNDDFWATSNQLTVESVQNFKRQLFKKIHVECLIYGNVRRYEALEIASLVNSTLLHANNSKEENIIPLSPEELVFFRGVKLKPGYFLYEMKSEFHNSSGILTYYQIELESTQPNMHLELFQTIISDSCFTILRTNERLGYLVNCAIASINGAKGLMVIIQSEKNPQFVQERIDNFMELVEHRIKNMSKEEFNIHKKSLEKKIISGKPETIEGMAYNFLNEIYFQLYNFNKSEIQIANLRKITIEEIISFYKKFIKDGSSSQHKLSVHVIPSTGDAFNEFEVAKKVNQPKLIKNITTFKSEQSLYPSLQPLKSIS